MNERRYKPLLCKLGLHQPDKETYIKVTRYRWTSKKKYHRNYVICRRCGKCLYTFGVQRQGGKQK